MAKKKESKQVKTESEELKTKFHESLKESKAFMQPIQQRMDKDYEIYRNYRYQDDLDFKISDFYAYVETIVPIMTNSRIRATVYSEYPEYITHAKGLNDILDHTYDINNWDYISQEIARTAMIYRFGLVYTGYDKNYKNGTGKLCLDQCNSRWAWIDPSAVHSEDSRFFFYVEPMRKTQALKMYPDKKDEIYNATNLNSPGAFAMDADNGQGSQWFRTWLGTVKNFLNFNNQGTQARQLSPETSQVEISEQQKNKNMLAHIHFWYRDDDDKWRVSYWLDDVFCHDEANPFWHEQLPYDFFTPIKDPLSMLGLPVNEQIENMSIQRNLLMQYYINNAKLHGNPPLLYNTTFGNVRDPEKLKEQARDTGIITLNNPDMVPLNAIADYMTVPNMPNSATGLFEHLGSILDNVTGVNDSFRGTAQASSGKEVQLQQEAAYTRVKTMIDQYEVFNKKIAEKVLINAMQFYKSRRAYRIKGDYTKYDNDQQMMGEEMPLEIKPVQTGMNQDAENPQPIYDRTEFFMYANPNEWTKIEGSDTDEEEEAEDGYRDSSEDEGGEGPEQEEVEKAYKILQMTVEIEAGSSLPQSRIAMREEAAELFQFGAIDQEALLQAYDYPDRDQIIKRMEEKAKQAAEAQAQAAQAEAQAKAQGEQAKIEAQMQLEQLKIQADMQKTDMNNQAKVEQQKVANKGKVAEQGAQNSGARLDDILQHVRQSAPEAKDLSDEELLQLLGT